MSKDDPKLTDQELEKLSDQPVQGKEIDEFFQKLPNNFRWPKPNAEALAAAVEVVHRMSGGSAVAQELAADGKPEEPGSICPACARALPAGARFCVWCGVPNQPLTADGTGAASSGSTQQHIHHHYHHVASGLGAAVGLPVGEPETASTPRGRAPGSAGLPTGGRAEASARQVVQDWAQACNTKHIDDLLELYSADATVIRSSVPPVRSLPAIREFLVSLLEAGLGDVEMESLRIEVMGDIALDLGRCKMLVPVAMSKRREERGKYLVVLVKQPTGTWKIMVDCWSSDLAVSSAPVEPRSPKGK